MIAYCVTSLLKCIPTSQAVETVWKRLMQDRTLDLRTNFSLEQNCNFLDLCLSTTYFKYNKSFYRQIHGCAMGFPTLNSLFRYVDDNGVKNKIKVVEAFTEPLISMDSNVKFIKEDMKEDRLSFLDRVTYLERDGGLDIEV